MIMKKMYTNKPLVETAVVEFDKPSNNYDLRIKKLEDTVRQLTEHIHKLSSELALNSRKLRRQDTDIHNVTTVLRNR